MDDKLTRRAFAKRVGAVSLGAGALTRAARADDTTGQPASANFRVGFVGIGNRGVAHLDIALSTENVEVSALCDTSEENLNRAATWVKESGQPAPTLYNRGGTDFVRMCEEEELDLVVTATPWRWHAPVCVAAMKGGKHAATEVPAALTVEQCWQLVEISEQTGKHCTMLEQANYSRFNLMVLRMAREGVFGELLNAAGGYVHDLREARLNPNYAQFPRKLWRLGHAIRRNGNLYPTHPMGPIAWWLDLGRGDRLEYLVSMSSKAVSLNEYACRRYGSESQYAGRKMALGDVNVSLLRTAQDRTVTLYFDTNTPHPHTSELRLQGSRGVFSGNEHRVHIDGRTDPKKKWDPLTEYAAEYEHPLWEKHRGRKYGQVRGHGGSGVHNQIMWQRLVDALRDGQTPDVDVYDAVTWSVISPLAEESVSARSRPVDFPDFSRGQWKTRAPVRLV